MTGILSMELTGADPEESLAMLGKANIELRDIRKSGELTAYFSTSGRNRKVVEAIAKKRGDSLRIIEKSGMIWTLKRGLGRPGIPLGILVLFLLTLWIPSRVFFVRVEGNRDIPTNRILSAGESCGICFGADRSKVRSEQVKNALLSELPQLQWAGVNTSGCTAVISVREKAVPEKEPDSGAVGSVLASRDGYVLSATATAGNVLVKPGMSVKKDQVLISGYTDCGFAIRAEWAQGEIFAQTNRNLRAIMPVRYLQKGDTTGKKRKWSLLIRKKRIFLWKDSGIWVGSCGRMYEEYYATLPGGFQLPVALCVESYDFTETQQQEVSAEAAASELKQFAQGYLLRQMVAGRIMEGVQSLEREGDTVFLTGEYACTEMIGITRQEQIGDSNGKNS